MKEARIKLESIIVSTKKLGSTEPKSMSAETIRSITAGLVKDTEELTSLLAAATTVPPEVSNFSVVAEQVEKLHAAALVPERNYRRIAAITNQLRGLAKVASLPQNAAIRPRIQEIVRKTAGIFSQIDTVEDLDKPLEQIEKAVHKLYGDQSSNSTYNFEARGKGNHGKDKS